MKKSEETGDGTGEIQRLLQSGTSDSEQRCLKTVQRCSAKGSPDLFGDRRDQADFLPLLVFAQAVALLG